MLDVQFGAVINYSNKNYNFMFKEQDVADGSTYNIEGHHVKLSVSTDKDESLPSAINEKLKALQKSSTTLKDIYAVVLGIDESALKLNANEPFATFDAIKKFAEEQLKTTKVPELLIRFHIYDTEIEHKLDISIERHDKLSGQLRALDKRQWSRLEPEQKSVEMALNVLTLGALPALKALRQALLESQLRDRKIEVIENLYKLIQIKPIETSEDAAKLQPKIDVALEQALWIEHIGYINELLKAGGKLKTEHIVIAVGLLSHRIMDMLSKKGIHVDDVKWPQNLTLLHLACGNISKPLNAIKFLLEYGRIPEKKNDEGVTPMHLALKNNLPLEIIQLLLGKVKNLDLVDNNGRSLLYRLYRVRKKKLQFC